MNKYDELTGTLVLVHPHLVNDPAGKHNQIGMITSADLENDDIMVSFGKDGQGRYATDALMVFKKNSTIYFDMMKDATKMEVGDFKEIFRISMLLDSGLTKDQRVAMELAKNNPLALEYSMATIEEELGNQRSAGVVR